MQIFLTSWERWSSLPLSLPLPLEPPPAAGFVRVLVDPGSESPRSVKTVGFSLLVHSFGIGRIKGQRTHRVLTLTRGVRVAVDLAVFVECLEAPT